MRGPGYKVVGDVRRTWRCPNCGRERKLSGDVTTLQCVCKESMWMRLIADKTNAPRPFQKISDVERRPIDFGIEPAAPTPPKPEATIIKSAISRDSEPELKSAAVSQPSIDQAPPEVLNIETPPIEAAAECTDDEWGEGIL